jgi:hypothetical protein
MCAKLGIELIAASSPQAKGRMERVHGTHQDWLVKKLRRKEIRSHEATNVYLQQEYLPEHNRRFARTAAQSEDYHRRAPRNWRGYSGRRASVRSAKTGWRATRTGFSNSRCKVATTRQHAAKCRCAKGGTATSPSSIAVVRYAGRKSPRQPRPAWRSSKAASRVRRKPSASGCQRPIIRGGKPPAGRWNSAPRSCSRGQGQRSNKQPKRNQKEGDTSNEVGMGTFLKSFDILATRY